jgi:conjugal transfer pilus assembly protein TraF
MLARLILLCMAALAFNASATNPYFKDKERGWLWREEHPAVVEPDPLKEPPESAGQPSNPVSEEFTELDVAWLKANMEKIMVTAINNPTQENLAAYAYSQRLMLDMSSRFSSKMTDFMKLEDALNETNRRPMAQFAINSFKGEQLMSVRQVFDAVKARSGIWFFYSSTCTYCVAQVPVLNQLKLQYGIDILAISMDGGVIPGMEEFDIVMDHGFAMSERFGVTATPSMFMVDSESKDVIRIAEGVLALPELEEKIMIVARERGFVSDEEYMLTRGVREVNVFRNDDGQIMAETEKLETDPGYLADLLRQKLKDLKPYGTVNTD